MAPKFVCRLEDITERADAPKEYNTDPNGNWIPISTAGWNVKVPSVASPVNYCDGNTIRSTSTMRPEDVPTNLKHFSTFSVYYKEGQGCWVIEGDGTNPQEGNTWHPLTFEHHDDYSSSLTNAGDQQALRCQHKDAKWPRMLLPDIYHGTLTPYPEYGGLQGELPIFLALLGLSVGRDQIAGILPHVFKEGLWRRHKQQHTRIDKRGIVATVWAVDGNDDELTQYEAGAYGPYYHL